MFFGTSGVEVAPYVPPLVAFCLSFFCSMGGLSGAFLLLPFQMSVLGYTAPSVSATNQLFNIVAIPGGVLRYMREGRMVWPLAWIVVIGTLPGVLIGAVVRVKWLPDAGNFKLFAGLVLLYIGIRMSRELLQRFRQSLSSTPVSGETPQQNPDSSSDTLTNGTARAESRFEQRIKASGKHSANRNGEHDSAKPVTAKPVTIVEEFSLARVTYVFLGERFTVNTGAIFLLTFSVGILGGIYGIGGGAIIAPFFVSVLGLPVYTIAGPCLMGTFVTSVAGVTFYQLLAWMYPEMSIAPDWWLGLLFGLGGLAGMYLGARTQKFVPARYIKAMLLIIIFSTSIKYIAGFFL